MRLSTRDLWLPLPRATTCRRSASRTRSGALKEGGAIHRDHLGRGSDLDELLLPWIGEVERVRGGEGSALLGERWGNGSPRRVAVPWVEVAAKDGGRLLKGSRGGEDDADEEWTGARCHVVDARE